MMEFKIQVSYDDGKVWMDSRNHSREGSYKSTKELCDFLRKENIMAKYRIVGREILPWCEIKESEAKHGD